MKYRRTRTGRFIARRKVRRNPATKRVKHHSPAMRRKIGLAVKRAMRTKSSGRAIRRQTVRSSAPIHSVTVRRHHSPAMRRKIGLAVRRSMAGGRSSVGRPLFRRSGMLGPFTQSFTRPTLMKAGGAVTASIGTGMVLRNFGARLPFVNQKFGKAIYSLLIPSLGAWAIQRKSRDFAEGLVIGGVVMAITEIIKGAGVGAGTIGSFGADLDAQNVRGLPAYGSYGVAGELGYGAYPVGSDLDTLGAPLVTPAFPGSAW